MLNIRTDPVSARGWLMPCRTRTGQNLLRATMVLDIKRTGTMRKFSMRTRSSVVSEIKMKLAKTVMGALIAMVSLSALAKDDGSSLCKAEEKVSSVARCAAPASSSSLCAAPRS